MRYAMRLARSSVTKTAEGSGSFFDGRTPTKYSAAAKGGCARLRFPVSVCAPLFLALDLSKTVTRCTHSLTQPVRRVWTAPTPNGGTERRIQLHPRRDTCRQLVSPVTRRRRATDVACRRSHGRRRRRRLASLSGFMNSKHINP